MVVEYRGFNNKDGVGATFIFSLPSYTDTENNNDEEES